MKWNELTILVISENFPPTVGGSAAWLGRIAESWPGDVRVLSALVDGAAREESDGHVSVRRIPFVFPSWAPDSFTSAKSYWSWIRATLRVIRENAPAVALCGRGIPEGVVARVARRRAGVPYAILAHGEEITTCQTSGLLRRFLAFAYRGAALVIANSANTARLVASCAGPEVKCVVAPPGVAAMEYATADPADIARMKVGTQGRIVLSIGRLEERKNHVGMVRAIAELVRQGMDVTYLIGGEGDQKPAIEAAAAGLGVSGRVRLLGLVPQSDLVPLYHAADVFALPGIRVGGGLEGFGIVFLEAAAAGKVCIAGNSGGSGEAVLHGKTGFVVDGNDAKLLSETLGRVLSDDAMRDEMGKAAQERVRREFDWPIVLAKLREAMLQAIAAKEPL